MKLPSLLARGVGVIVALALAWPVYAQTAPANISFQPAQVNGTVQTTILVTASNITPESQVVLDGFGALQTTVTGNQLSAVIPAGIPGGSYTVRVVNADGQSGVAASQLIVIGPTNTPQPTNTPAPTAFARPQITVVSFGASAPTITAGQNYDFEMTLANSGGSNATNIVAVFESGDFEPRATGGTRAVGSLSPGQTVKFFQPLFATRGIAGKPLATLKVTVSYTNIEGQTYSDVFTLTFPVQQFTGPAQSTATPTTAPVVRPQLLVTTYRTGDENLQPGSPFELELDVRNVGNATARGISLVVGGGATSGNPSGTPPPGGGSGGVTGGGGDFANFAPLGASNVQSLNDMEAGDSLVARQPLIVNSSTNAGAYPMKITFIYTDQRGNVITEDQVITILVYKNPNIEVSFSRPPDPLFAFQPGLLPIQLTNLRRETALLGTMTVEVEGGPEVATLENNSALVGSVEPGGTFPLDATIIPNAAGPIKILVTINYTDDFNQAQRITAELEMEVFEGGGPIDPGIPPDGGPIDPGIPEPGPESTWDMLVRLFMGLIGLDSGRPRAPGVGLPGPIEPLPEGPGGGGIIVP